MGGGHTKWGISVLASCKRLLRTYYDCVDRNVFNDVQVIFMTCAGWSFFYKQYTYTLLHGSRYYPMLYT